ncbi:putative transcription factor C2H2 family [Lupinus albus]|uniref:Putative transcription factor C2H2 family n=1 Tax=Lupinus albus TaxID=3870 RepID=A0A6A4NJV8_LUPAL|nr:putative transcription factor C2H2 family [Lupinus albus]
MKSLEELAILLVFIAIITFIVTFGYYLSTLPFATNLSSNQGSHTNVNNTNQSVTINVEPEPCLDQNTTLLHTYPTILFSKAKLCKNSCSSSCSCCSICLVDYKESDFLRVLPRCGHFFHVKCVDPWLIMNFTCPICRERLHNEV